MRERSAQPSGQQSGGVHTVTGAIVWIVWERKEVDILRQRVVCVCEVLSKLALGCPILRPMVGDAKLLGVW